MAANAVDFAGTLCGCRYEKELETHFRDCLLFYIDGRIGLSAIAMARQPAWCSACGPTGWTKPARFCG